MKINITQLGQYFVNSKCPTQIMLDTNDQESVLHFLRGPDENGSLAVFLSYEEINDILMLNAVESKMIQVRDLSPEELRSLQRKDHDKEKAINDILYGTLSKYIMQLFVASTGELIYPNLEILPNHKKAYFASIFYKD